MKADISNIIKVLQSGDFYGAGKCVEIAKGKNEYVSTWREFKRKIIRQWRSLKR